ncbi:MAG: hypothetical protein GY839_14830, partial [candidate division Zixibacteria bacterium]|nr:hypothetical protein [candidate division Zixibacteria bacterium]
MFKKPQSIKFTVLSLILVLFVIQGAFAQSDISSWQNLKLGPYPVGFKTIEKYDYSRTFRSKHDYFGNPVEGERARPIQIGIWYPAKEMKNPEVMVYGEYAFAYPEDESFINVLTNMQERENRFLFSINENNPGPVLDLMSINVNAVKDAPEQEGTFPLIIYCPSLRGNISENAQLCEFIASNGFVVATSHSMGATGLNPEINQTDLEALVRDKEFVIANMHSQPNVNINKIGVIGFAAGGMTALIMQMRNTDIDAVVSINGTFINSNYKDILTNNHFYQADRIQSPQLIVYTSEITTLDFSLVDAFKYSDRYLLELSSLQHSIFSHHGITPISSQQAETDYYEIPLNFVNNFLKAELDSDNNSM